MIKNDRMETVQNKLPQILDMEEELSSLRKKYIDSVRTFQHKICEILIEGFKTKIPETNFKNKIRIGEGIPGEFRKVVELRDVLTFEILTDEEIKLTSHKIVFIVEKRKIIFFLYENDALVTATEPSWRRLHTSEYALDHPQLGQAQDCWLTEDELYESLEHLAQFILDQ